MSTTNSWWQQQVGASGPSCIAYFSAEFGLKADLPIYSGGLGVLAGDHLKSAADLGLPMVAVGLFYREGYFHQDLDASGRQSEHYVRREPESLGLVPAEGLDGLPVAVPVPMGEGELLCRVWRFDVGTVPLFLLDSEHPDNPEELRGLTARLYAGGVEHRIRQEVVLGIGGLRALHELGFRPDLLHLNEGHTAFAALEQLRFLGAEGADPAEAWATSQSRCVFTTHTPVPAGHDRFEAELVREVVGPYRQALGWDEEAFLDLGRVHRGSNESFCMTVLALKAARTTNGVAKRHGEVSREMWKELWPDREQTPIGHITNGVHTGTWLGPRIESCLDAALGADWPDVLPAGGRIDGVDDIGDAELWEAHLGQKQRLLAEVQRRSQQSVDPDSLVIGFARRFATYKRGDLLLTQTERARTLLLDRDRPVALLFAGKAHPKDAEGKAIIERLYAFARELEGDGRLVFLPDYDMDLGALLTQGADLWLNNPRRPREASGTSGQKAAMNGVLNCSTLDGWWLEGIAREPLAGWAVGRDGPVADQEAGDLEDAEALYEVLSTQVLPCFFDRNAAGLPEAWLRRMKASIASSLAHFSAERMVADYARQVYTCGRVGLREA